MIPDHQEKSLIVFISTFPPRQCGIATFTADLANTVNQTFRPFIESKIVAMNISDISPLPYSDKVIFQISQPNVKDYVNTALGLNQLKKVRLVNIQHEFGIFGGEYGSYIILFLKKIKKPVVVTFHTVLPSPDKKMLDVVQNIAKYSKGIIVMTRYAKELLERDYGLNPIKIQFIIAGVTHPVVLEQEGESYRNSLIKRVYELGLNNHVLFYNTFSNLNKLLRFLEATDIYLSSSLNPKQTVSGTLSYAMGSGRPVISTSFAQAKEDITDKVGILIDFKSSYAFTNSIIKLLSNDQLRVQMGKNAYFRTRHMTWENVVLSYIKYFTQFVPELSKKQKKLPTIKLTHLAKLTDNFGVIQFAKLTEPDISSGYTLDDNARALIVAATHYKKFLV